jgi:voltage-gated potassium channel
MAYATSLFGLVDLLAILPTWIALFLPGAQSFQVIRGLRLLRAFRILRMVEYVREAQVILVALRASARKITVFLGAILTAVTIIGATMYVVEGPQHGFDSIPRAMYWAVVTLSTVGYGDISPKTALGQLLASLVMMLGYSVLAVPTGIVTVEIAQAARQHARLGQACPGCGREGHEADARFCRHCGTSLDADGGG